MKEKRIKTILVEGADATNNVLKFIPSVRLIFWHFDISRVIT